MSNLEERVTHLENHKPVQAQGSPDVDEVLAQLRSDLNERDQELLANDIQITNIPETSGENPTHTVMLVASKMGVKIETRDIVSAERVGGRRIKGLRTL